MTQATTLDAAPSPRSVQSARSPSFEMKVEFEEGLLTRPRPVFVNPTVYNQISPDLVVSGAVFKVREPNLAFDLELELLDGVSFDGQPELEQIVDPQPAPERHPIVFDEFSSTEGVVRWTGDVPLAAPDDRFARWIYSLPIRKDLQQGRLLLPFVFMTPEREDGILKKLRLLSPPVAGASSASSDSPAPRAAPQLSIRVSGDSANPRYDLFDYSQLDGLLPDFVRVDPFFAVRRADTLIHFVFNAVADFFHFDLSAEAPDHPQLGPEPLRLAMLWEGVRDPKPCEGCITPTSFQGSSVPANRTQARVGWLESSELPPDTVRAASFFFRGSPHEGREVVIDPTVLHEPDI